jgi:hypothetical protein
VRGTFSPDDSVERTSWSVKTLQEQTIIAEKILVRRKPCQRKSLRKLVQIETVNKAKWLRVGSPFRFRHLLVPLFGIML